jgi:dihydrofolate synthase/folylpolyglutamate synthase
MSLSANSSLEEWLRHVEAIHPTEIELGLERLKIVSDRLLDSASVPFVFTVAGTNGKGTTTAALSALSEKAGLRVGWYSSPHLLRFNERVRINQEPVTDTLLANAFHAVEQARGPVSLSYFEFTTLAAFWLFAKENLDVWVLEIGLGGRLDAVNVIDPDIAVVTNIGLDHQDFLGSDLEGIAREKLGIARAGKPLVLGSSDIAEVAVQEAVARGAELYRYGDSHGLKQTGIFSALGLVSSENIRIPLRNASAALQAFALSGFRLSAEAAQSSLEAIAMPGRLQSHEYRGTPILLDVGHNPHAAKYLATQLGNQSYHLIIGMLNDKDAEGFVATLLPVAASISFVSLSVPRGLTASELAYKTESITAPLALYSTISEAITSHVERSPNEPLFIGGSFYTVCDALTYLES